ncbi:MAG: hypothetical protein GY805_10000 [Chloroflexi bacterium]|nr:hypothetical protein [Chloroflexota bacterium]
MALTVTPTQEMGITAVSPPSTIPQPTITPVPLSGLIQDQVEPGMIHPDRPLVIEFDQALMELSGTDPLIFEPPVAGSFSWNDRGTRLIFTPDHGFAVGEAYQITQSSQLLARSGVPLGEPLVWQIQTLSALFMASSETQESEVITDDEWLITFPIDFLHEVDWQSVEEEIMVEPAAPVKISWWENGRLHQKDIPDGDGRTVNEPFASSPETNQMLVQARVPFDFQQTYRFMLQEWVTDCTGSAVLKVAFEREFALPSLRAETVQTGVVPQFRFNYRLDLDSLLSAVILVPEFETEWRAEWDGDETVLTMDPSNLLPNKILYDMGFHEPVYHENGVLISPPNKMAQFPTPIIISDEYPGREHWIKFNPNTNIKITFVREMDEETVMDAFQIEPDVPGAFFWEDNQLIFQPEAGHLDAFSQYTITLGASMKDSDGRLALPEPYEWQFETSELPTEADFGLGTKVQMVAVNGRRAVQYRSYPQEPVAVTFGLYALAPEEAFQFLRGEHDGVIGVEVSRWTAVTEPKEGDNLRYASTQETHIPPDVLPGPYLMTLDAGASHDELIVFISENSVVAKLSESQITVWTTKINGEDAGNLDVSILDENGAVAANGRSSDEGLFQTDLTNDAQVAFVIVQEGNDLAVTGLNSDWQTVLMDRYGSVYYGGYQQPLKTLVYIHTDRPLYRPDETVFFKAILRNDNDVQMEPFPIGTLVAARLKTPDGELLQTLDLETNAFGSVTGQFQLPDTAVSGDYEIEIITADEYIASQIFKVDAYQPDNYEVTVSTDAEFYLEDDTVFVTVDSAYLTGEPVANAKVEVNLFVTRHERWDQWGRPSESITGTTDIDGRFTAELALTYGNYVIEAIVNHDTGQPVHGFKQVMAHSEYEEIYLDIGAFHKEPDSLVLGTVTISDNFGDPVVAREVNLMLSYCCPDGTSFWEFHDFSTGQTDENGRYTFTFTPQGLGYHKLRAVIIDQAGYHRTSEQIFVVYRETENGDIGFTLPGDLESQFLYTKDVYAPGEPAKLYIQSTVAESALLTLARGDVQQQRVVDLLPPLTVVEVAISENDAPNLFATIMIWKPYELPEWPRGTFSLPEYQLLASTVNLDVSTTHHALNVEVLPEQESYQPGKEAQITLRVTNHAGEPVSAELSLSVVDEAIFQLSPDFSEPMHDVFYFKRENQVTNYDAMNVQRQLWYDVGDVTGDIDGLSYYGLFENYRNIDYGGNRSWSGPHGEFVGTAAWYPTLHTDAKGEVTVSFMLPDEPATWRINARAITVDSQVGETVYSFDAN